MHPVIEVSGVRKTYGKTVAVEEASFEVNQGGNLWTDRAQRSREDYHDGVYRRDSQARLRHDYSARS